METEAPSFFIKEMPIFGRILLSPMDGVSDWPFRSLARRLGSAISYPEFVNAMDVISHSPNIDKTLTFLEEERPVFIQLFDDDPDRLLEAALMLEQKYHPDGFDINMGCPSRPVSGRGAGAGLLRTPQKIGEIFRKLVKNLRIPVTGKIRIGWDNGSLNYVQVARIIEDNGGAAIAVHGRTKIQGYTGQANWDSITEIKKMVKIPVIGNGDVRLAADITRMIDLTGCDAVMIGRAAIENPWILAGMDREKVPFSQVRATLFEHLQKMVDFYGARGVVMFRKFIKGYLRLYPVTSQTLLNLLTIEEYEPLKLTLGELFSGDQIDVLD